jgi:hypothetical protein
MLKPSESQATVETSLSRQEDADARTAKRDAARVNREDTAPLARAVTEIRG